MADFVTLTCPSCGGKLQVAHDIDRFACGYCGSEHVVRRSGGAVALTPVIESIKRVQAGTDKTASELAIKRLRDEIGNLEHQVSQARKEHKDSIQTSLIAVGGILLFGFLGFSQIERAGLWCIGPLVLAGLGMLSNVFYELSGKPLANKLEPLEKTLGQKRAELRRHEEIVKG